MKAIKDCEWEVEITQTHWLARPKQDMGIRYQQGWQAFMSRAPIWSKLTAKHNWEKFAKINGIKKWKYV